MTGDRRSPTRAHFHQMPRNPVLTERIEGNFAFMYVEVQMVRMRTTRKPRKSKSADIFHTVRFGTDTTVWSAETLRGKRAGGVFGSGAAPLHPIRAVMSRFMYARTMTTPTAARQAVDSHPAQRHPGGPQADCLEAWS